MTEFRYKDHIIRYTVYGILFGLITPLISLFIHVVSGDVTFTFGGYAALHMIMPAQYLLDILPIAGGITGYLFSKSMNDFQHQIHNIYLNELTKDKKILDYINNLIENKLDSEIHLDEKTFALEKSLDSLRTYLKNNTEEENRRKQEDYQRSWVAEGLARFGEILRYHTDNIEEFSYNLISNLVKYLDINQGGFFLVEEREDQGKFFDMKASYAYDRKKFANRQIEWGEGLIGTCALEKQSVYLSDIPETYLLVTSGLGHDTPKFLLIIPLINQNEVLGVIELASFRDLQTYEISFAESVCESIAITLSGVRSNMRTSLLLKDSQQQAEILARQEEKMRQSMDELKEIQEQAAKQAEKFISFTSSVNHTLIRAEYNIDGILLYANTKFLGKLGYFSNSEVEGKHISMFINVKDMEWFDKIWERLAQGGKHYEGYMKHVSKQGQDLWTMATYTCVRKDSGEVDKILFLAIDTTEQKKQSLDYEGQIEAINRLNIKAEFAPDGKFVNCNGLFLDTMKYGRKELDEMSVFDFIDKKDIENFNEIWENITKGVPYQGQVKGLTKYEDEKWFRATYTAVNDMYGEVAKVIYLANEITNEKLMEIESRRQTDQLKIQEEKLRLAGVEMKKTLEQSRSELKLEYDQIENERLRLDYIIESIPIIILTINQSGKIVYINSRGEKFWNIRSQKIIGQDIKVLFPNDSQKYDASLSNFITPGSIKVTDKKNKINIPDGKGKPLPADMIVSMAEAKDEVYYTANIILS